MVRADPIDPGQGARQRALATGVRPAAGWLAVLYGVLGVLHQLAAPPGIRGALSTMAACTAVIAGGIFLALRRRPLAPPLAPHAAGFLAGLATANSLVHLALSRDPLQSSNLMLVVVAVGAIIDDDRWAAALAATTVVGWAAVAAVAAPSPMWAHFGYGLLTASILGALLRVVRRRGQHSLERARAQAAALATNDALTGLLNRRGLELVAEQALGVARRRHLPVVLLYCDLDGLKPINDTLGHGAGDAMLIEAARHLSAAFREADAVARVGGDEFVVLLVDAAPASAAHLRDRARACMSGIGVSVGAAIANEALRTSLPQLLDEADAQMYEEKRRKRDPAPGAARHA